MGQCASTAGSLSGGGMYIQLQPCLSTFNFIGKQRKKASAYACCFELWLKLEYLLCHKYTLHNEFYFIFFRPLKGITATHIYSLVILFFPDDYFYFTAICLKESGMT